ncbi:MAG: hypothetical protein V5A64_05785 [Candidatus Thermoplasmatota archaeon]
MYSEEWEEKKYSKTYNQTYNYIEYRKKNDAGFTISVLDEMLKAAYAKQGINFTGKGRLKHITETATIAALESSLAKWKKEGKER